MYTHNKIRSDFEESSKAGFLITKLSLQLVGLYKIKIKYQSDNKMK